MSTTIVPLPPPFPSPLFFLPLLALASYILYRLLLPHPIPGRIPYIPHSATRLLGDLPDMLAYQSRTSETISFLARRCEQLQSPIAQVFMRPSFLGGRPWVVLCEPREYVAISPPRPPTSRAAKTARQA